MKHVITIPCKQNLAEITENIMLDGLIRAKVLKKRLMRLVDIKLFVERKINRLNLENLKIYEWLE